MKCPKCLGTGEVQDQRAIGHRLQRSRIGAGLTIYDVASAMGLSPSHLSYLESGKRSWNPELIERYELALDQENKG